MSPKITGVKRIDLLIFNNQGSANLPTLNYKNTDYPHYKSPIKFPASLSEAMVSPLQEGI